MSSLFVDSTIATVVWIALKATVLLGVVAAVQAAIHRRASAASRHLMWMLAVVGVLMLPVVALVLPQWRVPIRSTLATDAPPLAGVARVDVTVESTDARASIGAAENVLATARRARGVSWWTVGGWLYGIGVIAMLVQWLVHQWRIRRIVRRASVVDDTDWLRLLTDCARRTDTPQTVRLLRDRESTMPMTFGIRRPSILIPAIAETWPDEQRRSVILHELAHVARYDCFTQTLAYGACALYWMHPGVWWVARRLRIEQELASDDRVIQAGAGAREYAGHLLEIAFAPSGQRAPALAIGMTRSRRLEGRLRAALDVARNREIPSARARMAGVAIAAGLLIALAGARPVLVASAGDALVAPSSLGAAEEQMTTVGPHLKAVDWPGSVQAFTWWVLNAAADALGIAQDILPGTWEIRPSSTKDMVNLRLAEIGSSSSSNVPIEQLEGLTAAQLTGPGGPITFQLRRDAGTFVFEGVLRSGVGAGTFSFKSDPAFPAELVKRGFSRPTAREQYSMARHDVGYAFIDELNRQGYPKAQTSELVRAGEHGVHVTYLREMGALGKRLDSLQALIELRDHGVTPAYIREMEALGYKGLSADALRNARDHGVGPEYVRAMHEAGYRSLSVDELIKARDHGVSAEYVRGMRDAGYSSLSLTDLINARDHGVSPEFVRQLQDLGYRNLSLEQAQAARDHGVSPEFAREMRQLGYTMPLNELMRIRDHGVSTDFVRQLAALGYDRLTIDDLVMLRDHGMTPDRIRAANDRAGTRLPIDMIKALAAGGRR
jgi:beta-lactamase regulating signal transducer with metallopeptidase domain